MEEKAWVIERADPAHPARPVAARSGGETSAELIHHACKATVGKKV